MNFFEKAFLPIKASSYYMNEWHMTISQGSSPFIIRDASQYRMLSQNSIVGYRHHRWEYSLLYRPPTATRPGHRLNIDAHHTRWNLCAKEVGVNQTTFVVACCVGSTACLPNCILRSGTNFEKREVKPTVIDECLTAYAFLLICVYFE